MVLENGQQAVTALVAAVDDVSFTIEAGTLVTLLGPSGCGKTTTLRMIAGLEMPTSGRILIGGKDVTLLPPNERDVQHGVPVLRAVPAHDGAGERLLRPRVGPRRKAQQRTRRAKACGWSAWKATTTRLPSELSGGQQQRVACARALVLEPQVLLFDEPLSNLDAKLRRRMREDIRDLQQSLGLTSVYVTHDQEEALAVSDKIIVMNKGRIAQEGTPADLYERPADAFVADFIGGANLIPCEIVRPRRHAGTCASAMPSFRSRHRGVNGSAGNLRRALGPRSADQWPTAPAGHAHCDGAQGNLSRLPLGIHARHAVRLAVPRPAGRAAIRARQHRGAAAGPAASVLVARA